VQGRERILEDHRHRRPTALADDLVAGAAEGERQRNDLLLCSEEIYRDGERMKKIQAQNADLKAMIELLYRKWEELVKEKEATEVQVP